MYLPRELISHLYTSLLQNHHPLSPPVLILAALSPDALCATRILTSLLKRDYIPHKIQPVAGYADLDKIGNDLISPLKTSRGGSGGVVVCLGVGAMTDVEERWELGVGSTDDSPCNGVEVWVMDARRPWNLDNVFWEPRPQLEEAEEPTQRRHIPGVEKGCIQRSYKAGQGGVIVFDDGDITEELIAERDAYCQLGEMPPIENWEFDVRYDSQDDSNTSSDSRKRKSWSDEDEEQGSDEDGERPRQRRRSNSGSSIASPRRSDRASSEDSIVSSSQREAKEAQESPEKLRRRLIELQRPLKRVLEEYGGLGTSYSEPISSMMYSLASDLGREDNDMLWLTLVGVSSLELSGHTSTGLGTTNHQTSTHPIHQLHQSWKINRSARTFAILRDEVRRFNPSTYDHSPSLSPARSVVASPTDTSIRLSPDPRFYLLRHWSLYDSMLHSPYIASRLGIWKDTGTKKLHKLLAKMGFSLSQCRQSYTHMDIALKKSLREQLLKYAPVYGLDDLVPDGRAPSNSNYDGWGFIRSWGWKAQLSALDVGVVVGAILEMGLHDPLVSSISSSSSTSASSQRTTTTTDNIQDRSETFLPRFFAAYDALAPTHPTHLLSSIPLAQSLIRAIHRTGSAILAKHQVRHLRAFRMGVVKDGPDLPLFATSPGALSRLALWIGEAIAVSERERKDDRDRGGAACTPLVLAALDEQRAAYLIVGLGGGMGSGSKAEVEAGNERREARKARQEGKKMRKEERAKAKAAEKAVRELDGESSDDEDEEEEEEEDSEVDSSDESEDEEANETRLKDQHKRGYGRNRFGLAFEEVKNELGPDRIRVKQDTFDHCVVEVAKEDLGGFLESLSSKTVVGR